MLTSAFSARESWCKRTAVQRSCMQYPSLANSLARALGPRSDVSRARRRWRPSHDLLGPRRHARRRCHQRLLLDVAARRARRVGLLDERFLIYGEDVDWCKRFNDAKWRVRFYPEVQALHYGGASSSNAAVKYYLEMQRANFQYWEKHRSRLGIDDVPVDRHRAPRSEASLAPCCSIRSCRQPAAVSRCKSNRAESRVSEVGDSARSCRRPNGGDSRRRSERYDRDRLDRLRSGDSGSRRGRDFWPDARLPSSNQTAPPREWVIVSDGSTDGTDELVETFARLHRWIRLIRLAPRQGRSFAVVVRTPELGVRYSHEHRLSVTWDCSTRTSILRLTYFATCCSASPGPRLGLAGGVVIDPGHSRTATSREIARMCQARCSSSGVMLRAVWVA